MDTKEAFVPSQPRATLAMRFRGILFQVVPFVVWLSTIGVVLQLAKDKARPLDYPGLALIAQYELTAPTNGTLSELLVEEQSVVAKGAVIGTMGGEALEIRAQQIQHAISQIRAEMVRDQELQSSATLRLQVDQDYDAITDARRFARDVENARLNLLEVQARIEESRIRLAGLQIDLQRQKGLSAQELFSEADLIRTRTEHDALATRIELTEAVVKGRQDKLIAVEARLSGYRAAKKLTEPDMQRVLGPYAWRINIQEDELALIAVQRQRLVVRAPSAGKISRVLAQPGQRVMQGQSIVELTHPKPRAMVTYVPESEVNDIRAGMRAIFERSSRPGLILETKVLSIGSAVVEVPAKVQSTPRVREWRVPVYLQIKDDMTALPGESIRVRILSPTVAGD